MQAMLPLSELSKNQIDRLGDRLRKGDISEGDLRLLDSYRRSFSNAYENIVEQIRGQLGLEPTGRPQKTKTSIVEKLRRQSIRLSQIQDIAGCRIIVPDLLTQDEAVERLKTLFDRIDIDDRREQPSHGYRAVHVIVETAGKLIEVQVRTSLQHLWAEVSEKLAGVVDANIKYGSGDRELLSGLMDISQIIKEQEFAEAALIESGKDSAKLPDILWQWFSIKVALEELAELIARIKGEHQ